jgi:hypothetical protein
MLVLYANARGIDPGGMDRATLEAEISNLVNTHSILHPDEVPKQIDRWLVTEVLDMVDGEDWVDYAGKATTVPLVSANVVRSESTKEVRIILCCFISSM